MLSRMPRESSSSGSWRRELANALRDKRATVGVVGLGYVGLPMLVCAARAGFRAVGLDVDPTRVEALSEGRSYVSDVPNEVLADIRSSLRVSTRPSALRACDVVLICVPTPLTDNSPDLGYIERAGHRSPRRFDVASWSSSNRRPTREPPRRSSDRSWRPRACERAGTSPSPTRPSVSTPDASSITSRRPRGSWEDSPRATASSRPASIDPSSTRSNWSRRPERPRWPS